MGPRRQLAHFQVSQLLEDVHAEDLGCGDSLVCLVDQHLHYDLLRFRRDIGNQLGDPHEGSLLEVKFHMSRIFLKVSQDGRVWRPENVVDFVDLVQLVISGEERKER